MTGVSTINSNARSRRLEADEYARIHEQLSKSSNRYAAPAFALAIETSLRRSTLFNLRWEWVDLSARMIRFPANMLTTANKGIPAVLPLSSHAVAVLRSLYTGNQQPKQGLVLDTTVNAVSMIWKDCRIKLGITDLHWHDLRHEAASRLFEKGLHPMEVASITGHRSMQMLKRYTHLRPENLLAKLG